MPSERESTHGKIVLLLSILFDSLQSRILGKPVSVGHSLGTVLGK